MPLFYGRRSADAKDFGADARISSIRPGQEGPSIYLPADELAHECADEGFLLKVDAMEPGRAIFMRCRHIRQLITRHHTCLISLLLLIDYYFDTVTVLLFPSHLLALLISLLSTLYELIVDARYWRIPLFYGDFRCTLPPVGLYIPRPAT